MTDHHTPTTAEIRTKRVAAGLTQAAAADLVCGSLRAWEEWEAGRRKMHPGLWRLFLIEARRPN